jgi:hypothetical protein
MTSVHVLVREDTQPIGDDQREIRAFINVRNEILRLPQTIAHYRRIGVARFFVTDNGSTDGSKEFLLEQPDCHVFSTGNSYAESGYGLEWQHALLDHYGTNHWCLLVDADEWLVYPGYETLPLSELTTYLDQVGAQGMFTFLLDMYGSRKMTEAISASERSLLDACPHFDREYDWCLRHIPGLQSPRFPEYNIVGGPRLRLFFPFLHRHAHLLGLTRALWYFTSLIKLPLPLNLRQPPCLFKIPLVHWLPGTRYRDSHKTATSIKLSNITGVLLHFKFLHDFHERISTEVNRKEHWDDASEYARYAAKLIANPSLSFYHNGSLAYEGSEQLVRLGLLKDDPEWRRMYTVARDPLAITSGNPAGQHQSC